MAEEIKAPEPAAASRPARTGRKSGGRAARRAARAAGAEGFSVQPGIEGGQYKPLSDADIQRIHTAALDVLEQIGVADPLPEMLEYALPAGCKLGDDGRLRFPRGLVEDIIAGTAREYVMHAPEPGVSLEISGERVILCTSGEAVNILEYATQEYRPSTLTDLYDAARLADRMEHIHCYGQPFIATEWRTSTPTTSTSPMRRWRGPANPSRWGWGWWTTWTR